LKGYDIMTNYGEIVIRANTIEEAEKDLEMIKALAKMGAVCGSGSSELGTAEAIIPTPQKPCCCCKCCDDETDLYDKIADTLADLANGYISPYTALECIADIIADL
jgi:hypothetical protein